MRIPKNKHVLSRMEDKTYNVLEFPCGWFIVDLSSSKAGYMLDLTSTYSMFLRTDVVFYRAELINDEGVRWQGLVTMASLDPAMIPLMRGPGNVFISKDHQMAWDSSGHCIHWGPAPFRGIDEKYETWCKAELARSKSEENA